MLSDQSIPGVGAISAARVAGVTGVLRDGPINQFPAWIQNLQDCYVLPGVVVVNRRLLASGSVGNYAINHYCQFPGSLNDYIELYDAPHYFRHPIFPRLNVAHGCAG